MWKKWTKLTFDGAGAHQCLPLIHQLKQDGLAINEDFEWGFILSTGQASRKVVISFRDPAQATFYALKWLPLNLQNQ